MLFATAERREDRLRLRTITALAAGLSALLLCVTPVPGPWLEVLAVPGLFVALLTSTFRRESWLSAPVLIRVAVFAFNLWFLAFALRTGAGEQVTFLLAPVLAASFFVLRLDAPAVRAFGILMPTAWFGSALVAAPPAWSPGLLATLLLAVTAAGIWFTSGARRARARYRYLEEALTQLLDSEEEAQLLLDGTTGEPLKANAYLVRTFGDRLDGLCAASLKLLLGEAASAPALLRQLRAGGTGSDCRTEGTLFDRAGSLRLFAVRVRWLQVHDNPWLLFTFRDVTVERELEKAQKRNEQMLEESQRLAEIGGWERNLETSETHWTAQNYAIWELETSVVPEGDKLNRQLFDDATRSTIEAAVAETVASEKPFELTLQGRTVKGRPIWVGGPRSYHAIVFHDGTLDRMTTETGPIRGRTADDLSRIKLLGSQDTIPALSTVLHEIAGAVPLVIEIKDQSGAFAPTDGRLEAAVARDLETYAGPVAVMSFNPYTVERMRDLAPHVPRGLTTDTFKDPALSAEAHQSLRGMTMLEQVGAAFISHDARDLQSPHVARVRASGRPVLCWTIRSQTAADAALQIADQITFEGFDPA